MYPYLGHYVELAGVGLRKKDAVHSHPLPLTTPGIVFCALRRE